MAKEEKKAPKLRFNGYTNDWEHVKPKKYLKISKVPGSNGLIAKKLTVKLWGKGVVEKDTTFNGSENTKYFTRKSGQLMYGKLDFLHAAFGIVPQNLNNYESTADSPAFDINDVGDRTFLINYFLRPEFYLKNGEKANGSRKAKRIHEETFLNMPMQAPIKSEQEKIAKTLNSLNNTIQLHERKCEELALIKKALLQKLFPKKDEIKPEVRYENFSDAWEQRKLNNFLETSKLKNLNHKFKKEDILSVSGDYGIVNQMEFQGRSFAGASLKNYRVVEKQNVVYTKSPLKANPYGIIKANKGNKGIVSTLYAVYKTKGDVSANFVEYYFANNYRLNAYLKPIVNKGAKNTILISDDNAINGKVIFPLDHVEQKKIGAFLADFDSLITLHQGKLEKLKKMKKFLLQNMFI